MKQTRALPAVTQRFANALRSRSEDLGRLCILTAGRAGSELLVETLTRHPMMRWDGEVLVAPRRNALRYIRSRALLARTRGARAYGFELNSVHSNYLGRRKRWATFVGELRDEGFGFVRLVRTNIVRQAVDAIRSWGPKAYQFRIVPDESGVDLDVVRRKSSLEPLVPGDQTAPVHVDPMHLIYVMQTIEIHDTQLDEHVQGARCLRLVYERDLENESSRETAIASVLAVAGLKPDHAVPEAPPPARPLADVIANYDEVAKALAGTQYERYLDD